jgi:hypothetical protein
MMFFIKQEKEHSIDLLLTLTGQLGNQAPFLHRTQVVVLSNKEKSGES